jgi:DNA helicase HerA-like ATPase
MVGRLAEYVQNEQSLAYLVKVKEWNMNIWNIAQKIIAKKEIPLIQLDSSMSQPEKTDFMDHLAKALEEYRRFLIIIDEIHEVIPQTTGERTLEFERPIGTGANRQIRIVFTTRRPQIVTKDVFALIDVLVVFRMVYGAVSPRMFGQCMS